MIADIPDDAWQVMVDRADIWTLNAREAGLAVRRLRPPGVSDPASGEGGDPDIAVPDAVGLVSLLAAGMPLIEAVRRANVAAAIAVTRRGPATSPTSTEIDAVLRG